MNLDLITEDGKYPLTHDGVSASDSVGTIPTVKSPPKDQKSGLEIWKKNIASQ